MRGKRVDTPSAKQVVIPGFEDTEFFAFRADDPQNDPSKEYKSPPKVWLICVAESGESVAYGDTKAQAIEAARQKLVDFQAVFEKAVGVHIVDHNGPATISSSRCCE